jgi:hypothetical protein
MAESAMASVVAARLSGAMDAELKHARRLDRMDSRPQSLANSMLQVVTRMDRVRLRPDDRIALATSGVE